MKYLIAARNTATGLTKIYTVVTTKAYLIPIDLSPQQERKVILKFADRYLPVLGLGVLSAPSVSKKLILKVLHSYVPVRGIIIYKPADYNEFKEFLLLYDNLIKPLKASATVYLKRSITLSSGLTTNVVSIIDFYNFFQSLITTSNLTKPNEISKAFNEYMDYIEISCGSNCDIRDVIAALQNAADMVRSAKMIMARNGYMYDLDYVIAIVDYPGTLPSTLSLCYDSKTRTIIVMSGQYILSYANPFSATARSHGCIRVAIDSIEVIDPNIIAEALGIPVNEVIQKFQQALQMYGLARSYIGVQQHPPLFGPPGNVRYNININYNYGAPPPSYPYYYPYSASPSPTPTPSPPPSASPSPTPTPTPTTPPTSKTGYRLNPLGRDFVNVLLSNPPPSTAPETFLLNHGFNDVEARQIVATFGICMYSMLSRGYSEQDAVDYCYGSLPGHIALLVRDHLLEKI